MGRDSNADIQKNQWWNVKQNNYIVIEPKMRTVLQFDEAKKLVFKIWQKGGNACMKRG